MKKRIFTAGLVAALALSAGPALAVYRTLNGALANKVTETVFEVEGKVGFGPASYWCSAGDFARQVLNASATQRIYIWKALGTVDPSKPRLIQFSVTPPPEADTTPGLLLSTSKIGDNLSAAMARQYCYGVGPGEAFYRRG